jgi:hypothetical protein
VQVQTQKQCKRDRHQYFTPEIKAPNYHNSYEDDREG